MATHMMKICAKFIEIRQRSTEMSRQAEKMLTDIGQASVQI